MLSKQKNKAVDDRFKFAYGSRKLRVRFGSGSFPQILVDNGSGSLKSEKNFQNRFIKLWFRSTPRAYVVASCVVFLCVNNNAGTVCYTKVII